MIAKLASTSLYLVALSVIIVVWERIPAVQEVKVVCSVAQASTMIRLVQASANCVDQDTFLQKVKQTAPLVLLVDMWAVKAVQLV